MSLILTRRVGEALLYRKEESDGTVCYGRIYVVSVEGSNVRLALDAPSNTEIVRSELLQGEAYDRWYDGAPKPGVAMYRKTGEHPAIRLPKTGEHLALPPAEPPPERKEA